MEVWMQHKECVLFHHFYKNIAPLYCTKLHPACNGQAATPPSYSKLTLQIINCKLATKSEVQK